MISLIIITYILIILYYLFILHIWEITHFVLFFHMIWEITLKKMSCKLMRKSLCCIKLARRSKISYNVYRTLQTQNESHDGTADIVISGGGMGGTTLACALGKTIN